MSRPTAAELSHAIDMLSYPKDRAVIEMLEEKLEEAQEDEAEARADDIRAKREERAQANDHDASR